ncbi:MAG: DNA-directed RNA polymerase subunit beta', partial [Acidimicrobiia bacterium]|nr:DNA-directed RNA polymerase subunit beta' [Acidimicrobiia bacterium]
FATSDLNDLYRRVINRNNRLERLLGLGAPEIIVNNEKRMLQEAVDALFDNGRRGRPVTGPGNRPLKSLSDMLKGKQGRFRQNLLGKRVDYSGRSVIVAGPTLRLHQCGLPKLMALELFKPFVMKRLVDIEYAQNIKSAKRMVERRNPRVWDVLEEVIREHPVLLNRAPTLHRLGIQAFEPMLVEGKAIQLHPLVCAAFNADFDGDQMAVHVPLSAEAQAEARVLMLSSNNLRSPASGRAMTVPTQDMVIGAYYMSLARPGAKGEGRLFRNLWQLEHAIDNGEVDFHALIAWRLKDEAREGVTPTHSTRMTTFGRLLLLDAFPEDFREEFNATMNREGAFLDVPLVKNSSKDQKWTEIWNLQTMIETLIDRYCVSDAVDALDKLKNLCFKYASKSGLTFAFSDIVTIGNKWDANADGPSLMSVAESAVEKVQSQYERGIITDGERRSQEVRIWTATTEDVTEAMKLEMAGQLLNPIEAMRNSMARGTITQMRQIAGMRGLVANPRGDMIPRPIRSNFREGLETLEYFIATPGARKGLVDTALRTADSGYLTRRLVDVAQELIIRETDCGTALGLWIDEVNHGHRAIEYKLSSRVLANDVPLSDGTVLQRGLLVDKKIADKLKSDATVKRVRVRSVLTCDAELGVCALCYGASLASGKIIELGETVGVVAAQSIGEPGTQLTMRTFHTGGVAGKDLAGGLPRVVELFEARTPKGSARLSPVGGQVRIGEDDGKGIPVTIVEDSGEETLITLPSGSRLIVNDRDEIVAGSPLTDGPFLPGERTDAKTFRDTNRSMVEQGKRPAEGRPELMGITKASLATESWLSAASFQETTRVLTEAAIDGRGDTLNGLKENIIIGKLIPAGSGMMRYRDFGIDAPDYVPMSTYHSEDESPADVLSGRWEGQASVSTEG